MGKTGGILSNREQKRQFDQAVKLAVTQRRLQNAANAKKYNLRKHQSAGAPSTAAVGGEGVKLGHGHASTGEMSRGRRAQTAHRTQGSLLSRSLNHGAGAAAGVAGGNSEEEQLQRLMMIQKLRSNVTGGTTASSEQFVRMVIASQKREQERNSRKRHKATRARQPGEGAPKEGTNASSRSDGAGDGPQAGSAVQHGRASYSEGVTERSLSKSLKDHGADGGLENGEGLPMAYKKGADDRSKGKWALLRRSLSMESFSSGEGGKRVELTVEASERSWEGSDRQAPSLLISELPPPATTPSGPSDVSSRPGDPPASMARKSSATASNGSPDTPSGTGDAEKVPPAAALDKSARSMPSRLGDDARKVSPAISLDECRSTWSLGDDIDRVAWPTASNGPSTASSSSSGADARKVLSTTGASGSVDDAKNAAASAVGQPRLAQKVETVPSSLATSEEGGGPPVIDKLPSLPPQDSSLSLTSTDSRVKHKSTRKKYSSAALGSATIRAAMMASGSAPQTLERSVAEGEPVELPDRTLERANSAEMLLGDVKLEDLVPTRRAKSLSLEGDGGIGVEMKIEVAGGAGGGFEGDEGGIRGGETKPVIAPSGETPESNRVDGNRHDSTSEGEEVVLCPRSQFQHLKAATKSTNEAGSGGTGPTQATSSSSLFSSRGSLSVEAVKQIGTSVSAVSGSKPNTDDEEKRARGSVVAPLVNDSFPRYTIDNCDIEREGSGSVTSPSFNPYKKKQSRMKKLRNTIRASLRGSDDESEEVEEASQGGGSTISAKKKTRVLRHLEKNKMGSNRSITSSLSAYSTMTGNSASSTTSKGSKGWKRFRLTGRPRPRRASSSSDGMSDNAASMRVTSRKISNVSDMSDYNMSDVSEGSSRSLNSQQCLDFYDHSSHQRALASLISSSKTPGSGRSLGSTLATVEEMKHDEDHMHQLDLDRVKRLDLSDKSGSSTQSYYRHPAHEHLLVHVLPKQLFPDSPGWQCDSCTAEVFDLNVWAYVSVEKNFLVCESCYRSSGHPVTDAK